MRGTHRTTCTITIGIATLITTTIIERHTARAEEVYAKEDVKLNVGALIQPEALIEQDKAPDGGPGTGFFLRRIRLLTYGNLTKQLSFFVETEQANLGKDGDWTTSIFILDAFASIEATEGVYVDAGLMLVPFTRHDLQSATALNGIDYHSRLIQFPAGSQRIWRDVGVQGRATLADGLIQLRGGVFSGVPATAANMMTGVMERNPSSLPRVAGNARVVAVGKDDGFFLPGIRFAAEPTVSVGVGVDWQKGAIAHMDAPVDHLAFAADVFAELPTVEDQEVVAQATAVRYNDGDASTTTGTGGFVEAGYRIGIVEPIVAAELFNADQDAGDYNGIHGGANVFLNKHKANLKLDVGRIKSGTGDAKIVGTLQAQLLF
jgi:Phosphate-selective porin O and P